MAQKKKQSNRTLISIDDPRSPISEAYRTLRTNLQFASLDKPLKRILVTSSSPGEGKSTVCSNLAITMAKTGLTVIIVDGDLRLPTLHVKFGLNNFVGLTNVLFDKMPLEGILQKTTVENLKILSTGPIPPNPSEVLLSKKMVELLNQLDSCADMIIIDSPPLLAVTDAAILANLTDGVILTIEKGKTKLDAAKRAKELLDNVNAKILGTVLNKVDVQEDNHYYYYGEKRGKKG